MGVVYVRPCGPWKRKKLVRRYIYIYIYTPRPAVSSPKHLSVSHWYQEIFHGMTRGQDNGGGRRYRRSRYTHRCRSRRASALRGRRRGEGGEVRVAAFKEYKETYICARVYYVCTRSRLFVDRTETRLFLAFVRRHVYDTLIWNQIRKGGIFEECSLAELTLFLATSCVLSLARALDKHCG